MSNYQEINDDEFRVIGTLADKKPAKKSYKGLIVKIVILSLSAIVCVGIVLWSQAPEDVEADNLFDPEMKVDSQYVELNFDSGQCAAASYAMRDSVVVNDIQLDILVPVNAKPSLTIGLINQHDKDIILCTQATDVRADNGEITGSFVVNGQMYSHGYSCKWGFCSIVGDSIKLGSAPKTPLLEDVLNNNGSFFRQHPLVERGRIYRSTIKGKAIRKALCEVDGKHVVVMTRTRESIHDFSQALQDINVVNAIYLVGADSYTFYRDESGVLKEFNTSLYKRNHNVNYIYWVRK